METKYKQPHIESMENHRYADISGDEESTKPPVRVIEELNKEAAHGFSQEDSTLKSCLASEINVPKTKESEESAKLVLVVGVANFLVNLIARLNFRAFTTT